jgi:hypothetical protein
MIENRINFKHPINTNFIEELYLYVVLQLFEEIVGLIYHYFIKTNQNMVNKFQTFNLIFVKARLLINHLIVFYLYLAMFDNFILLVIANKVSFCLNYKSIIELDLIIYFH